MDLEKEIHQEFMGFMEGKSHSDLIEILHKTQDLYGYISGERVNEISRKMDIPVASIYGVITFYSRFSMVPKGKYSISVCMGTACYVKNAEDLLREFSKELKIGIGETTDDLMFSLIETRCLGDCAIAPVIMINEEMHGNVKIEDVKGIISSLQEVEDQ